MNTDNFEVQIKTSSVYYLTKFALPSKKVDIIDRDVAEIAGSNHAFKDEAIRHVTCDVHLRIVPDI